MPQLPQGLGFFPSESRLRAPGVPESRTSRRKGPRPRGESPVLVSTPRFSILVIESRIYTAELLGLVCYVPNPLGNRTAVYNHHHCLTRGHVNTET